MNYYDRSLLEDAFNKRRAKVTADVQYYDRGSYSGYFSKRGNSAQAITKIIHHHGNVKDLLKYVTDENRTGTNNNIFSAEGKVISKPELKNIESFWQKRNKQDLRTNARHSTHIILSTKESPNFINVSKLKEVVSQLAQAHFTVNGYDSFFTIHTDKPHLHAHLVVHNKNLNTGKKIKYSKFANIFSLRKDFADLLNQKGWNYCSTLRKDALEVRDGLDSQKKHQNYVLSQVEKDLGPVARQWTKKQFIEKFSEDDKKAAEAKRNLALVRNRNNPQANLEISEKIKKYEAQKRKWDIKKELHGKYAQLDPKSINSYVDSVFAAQNRFARSFNTKNKKSVDDYNSVTNLLENLTKKDVSVKITHFQNYLDRKKQRELEVKGFDIYGDIGKEYLKQLHRNLDYAKTDKQRLVVTDKISDLKKGIVDEAEFDFFHASLLKQNSKPFYDKTYSKRILALKKEVSAKSGVDIGEVTEVEKLFTLYCARRGSDSVYAYGQFKRGLDRYGEVLKSGDGNRIWHFSDSLDQKLCISSEQKYQKQANSQASSISR